MTVSTPTPIDAVSTDSPNLAAPDSHGSDLGVDSIGIEFEYPIAHHSADAPATIGENSSDLRREFTWGDTWTVELDQPGTMTSDHVGAEIISDILNVHSEAPERWYVATIQEAARRGYPFAACGYGDTTFGLHMHVDQVSSREWNMLKRFCAEDMRARVFFCASVTRNSLDPWRHSGASGLDSLSGARNPSIGHPDRRGPDGHYEFRLPEPMMPDHFSMVMYFWRIFDNMGIEAAIEYAQERVDAVDPRLTPVQQYQLYSQRYDDWPHDDSLATVPTNERNDGERRQQGAHNNAPEAVNFMLDLMGDS